MIEQRSKLQLYAYLFLTFFAIAAVAAYDAVERGKLTKQVVVIEQTIQGTPGARGKPGPTSTIPTEAQRPVVINRTVRQQPIIQRVTRVVNKPVPGPRGPTGPQGKPGVRGVAGVQGAQGVAGVPGIEGRTGADAQVNVNEIVDEVTERVLDELDINELAEEVCKLLNC